MSRNMKDTAFTTTLVYERSILLMTYDTASEPAAAAGAPLNETLEHLLVSLPGEAAPSSRSRGRPVSLSAWHLSLAVLVCLLRGRLVGLFDVRLQQWRRLDVLLDATANCKVHARAMLSGLAQGTLILFDRGYFSFPWLDELAQQGYWYVSRTVGKTSYQMLHIHYQADGVFDALVYLGRYRSDQAAQVARLVCFRVGSQRYSYLTNV